MQLDPQHPLLWEVLGLRKASLEMSGGDTELPSALDDFIVARGPTMVSVEVKALQCRGSRAGRAYLVFTSDVFMQRYWGGLW